MWNYIICDNHATLEIGSQTESIILWDSMIRTCHLSNVAGYYRTFAYVNCVLYKTIVVYISMVKLAYLEHFLYCIYCIKFAWIQYVYTFILFIFFFYWGTTIQMLAYYVITYGWNLISWFVAVPQDLRYATDLYCKTDVCVMVVCYFKDGMSLRCIFFSDYNASTQPFSHIYTTKKMQVVLF